MITIVVMAVIIMTITHTIVVREIGRSHAANECVCIGLSRYKHTPYAYE